MECGELVHTIFKKWNGAYYCNNLFYDLPVVVAIGLHVFIKFINV